MVVLLAGVHAIARNGSKLSYVMYNLSTGKAEQDSAFRTDTMAFLGQNPQKISLTTCGEVSQTLETVNHLFMKYLIKKKRFMNRVMA